MYMSDTLSCIHLCSWGNEKHHGQMDLAESNIMKGLFTVNMSLLREPTTDGQTLKV